ncbi:FAR1-related sequence 11-like protein [Tanacetum coccineum]
MPDAPHHSIKLKIGNSVMLMRNSDQRAGLCNGTTLQVLRTGHNIIEAKIISGGSVGTICAIPRMIISPSDTKMPFKFNKQSSIMLDLNEPPIEGDDGTLIHQSPDYEPFIGQTFTSLEEPHIFYQTYANQHGYTVRKDRFDKRKDKTVRCDIVCHRGGTSRTKTPDITKNQRNWGSQKCRCNVHMRLTLKRSFDIFPEEWHVTKFIKDHNHKLLSHEQMRFLPVNRIITPEDEQKILLYKEAGLKVCEIIRRRILGANEAMSLIHYMRSSKQKDSKFQYVYTVDEQRRLESLLWCHPKSFEWYEKYGDVVVFDTTYKVNAYDMPCALFVGVNNHGKTVLFGSAFLLNETVNTFRWLMKSWCGDFYTLYRMTSIEEFEHNWSSVVAKYNLQNNNHVQGLYKTRKSWAPAYLRNYFFGGMTSTSKSESINAFIKRFISADTCLKDFVKQMDLVVVEIENGETHDKMLATLRHTSLKTKSPLEEQASQAFTSFSFKKFQKEFERASQYSVIHVDSDEFLIRYYDEESSKNHKVTSLATSKQRIGSS